MNPLLSPMQPVAPPAKKMKATGDILVRDHDTVKKRREELDLLKQKQQMRSTTEDAGVLRSRGQLKSVQAQSHASTGFRDPRTVPPAAPRDLPRKSATGTTESSRSKGAPPPPPFGSSSVQMSTVAPRQSSEPVARRLDPSFARGKSPVPSSSRARSAPPSRPPPPPGPPPLTKETPARATSPARAFAARPPPTTPRAHAIEMPGKSKIAPSAPPVTTPKLPASLDMGPVLAPPATSDRKKTELPSSPAVINVVKREIPVATDLSKVGPDPSVGKGELPEHSDAQPPQSRRDLIQNLALGATTPQGPAKQESSLLRMEKEVRELSSSKAEALRRVAILEEQLQKLKEKGDSRDHLGTIVSGTTPTALSSQANFFSPLSPGLATPRANNRKRAPTPRPKRDAEKTASMSTKDEKEEMDLFCESVKCTPFEFTTDLATFVVRRPHGIAAERELWFSAGYLNAKQYEKSADVRQPHTLEVVALISADSSTLALRDGSFVRHNGADSDWREFGNVDDMEKPLGTITYIDSDACEKDYSLDDVYEGAVSARETYCTSVVSMVLGLKARGDAVGRQRTVKTPGASDLADCTKEPKRTVEIGVNTDELPMSDPNAKGEAPMAPVVSQEPNGKKGEDLPSKETSLVSDGFEDGPDTVTLVLGAFVSLLIWTGKTILITLPLKVVHSVVSLIVFFALICLLSLQVEEGVMGPYFSNTGIL